MPIKILKEKERMLDPLSDVFTRWLFGEAHNRDLLTDFINAVLDHKGEAPVSDLELRNPFNIRDAVQAKETILDIRARDEHGRYINLEVQLGSQHSYISRSLYYWARSYSGQLGEGDLYRKLEPVICINLLGFTLFPDLPVWHSCFHAMEQKQAAFLPGRHLSIHFVEVYNNEKLPGTEEEHLEHKLERWCFFFRNEGRMEEKDMPEELRNDEAIMKAHKRYGDFTADKKLLELAEAREKWLKDYNSNMDGAREEGLAEGWEEASRKHALIMLKDGLEPGKVALYTGLSEAEVLELKSRLV